MKFYVKYNEEIFTFGLLCPAISFIKYVGGKLYFKKPAITKQLEFDE